MVGLHRVFVGGIVGLCLRESVLVPAHIVEVGLADVDEPVHNVAGRSLESPEDVQIAADLFVGQHFHRQLDKRVVVANPYFAVAVAGIESGAYHRPGH